MLLLFLLRVRTQPHHVGVLFLWNCIVTAFNSRSFIYKVPLIHHCTKMSCFALCTSKLPLCFFRSSVFRSFCRSLVPFCLFLMVTMGCDTHTVCKPSYVAVITRLCLAIDVNRLPGGRDAMIISTLLVAIDLRSPAIPTPVNNKNRLSRVHYPRTAESRCLWSVASQCCRCSHCGRHWA
jgi:hypothetical protein